MPRFLPTPLGRIACEIRSGGGAATPVFFLHGVFFDRTVWDGLDDGLGERRRFLVDLPAHGDSGPVGRDWTLDECADLLVGLLDAFELPRAIVVGHSWGAMTALRAAVRAPERFAALGLCNMPWRPPAGLERWSFHLQRQLVRFPRFYARQAARALYTPARLKAHPQWATAMEARLARMPTAEIVRVIDAVILGPDDAAPLLRALRVPALALIGEGDYVEPPPGIDTVRVTGGHLSPHEAPAETRALIARVLALAGEAG